MARVRIKSKISIGRIIGKVVGVAIALWVGSSILTSVASAMNCTYGIFQSGFTFVGFGTYADGTGADLNCTDIPGTGTALDGTISTTGILSVLGIIGFAAVVMEFVSIKL